jgi:hypothetical protein
VNNEFESILKEVSVVYIQLQSWELSGETKENHENFSHFRRPQGRNLNPVPPEYLGAVLIAVLGYSLNLLLLKAGNAFYV